MGFWPRWSQSSRPRKGVNEALEAYVWSHADRHSGTILIPAAQAPLGAASRGTPAMWTSGVLPAGGFRHASQSRTLYIPSVACTSWQ